MRRGSRVGLTLWPPAAGAEAATRPASLKKGGEGSVATNTKEKLCLYIQRCFFFFTGPFGSSSHLPHSLLSLFSFSLRPFHFVLIGVHLWCWLGFPNSHVRPDVPQHFTGNDSLACHSGSEAQWLWLNAAVREQSSARSDQFRH